ncbi:MAG: HAD family hydrolase [bacterium]
MSADAGAAGTRAAAPAAHAPASPPRDNGLRTAAFFDMDGTLLHSNIVRFYLWYVNDGLRGPSRWFRKARLYASVPVYLAVDRFSRTALNHLFYRSYRGVRVEHFAAWNREAFERMTRRRVFPDAIAEVAALKRAGARIVLVTGATQEVVAPIAEHFGADHVIACDLEVVEGRYTGRMLSAPVGDEEKARRIREYAAREGIDLANASAYGDNFADLPMLEAAGHPVAVNPDKKLAREAARRGWPVRAWTAGDGGTALAS